MARRIISVRGKRAVVTDANVFVGGYRGGFGFGARIGEQPTRKSSGEAPRHDAASSSGLRWQRSSRGGPRILGGLGCFTGFLLDCRRNGSRDGLAAIFRERFTGEQDRFFSGIKIRRYWRSAALARCFGAAIIKAALRCAAWFESARLRATILALRTRLVATRISASIVLALRRSIFRGRQSAAAWPRTTSAAASAAPAETPAATVAAGILSAIVATVIAAIVPTAKILAGSAGTARRIILRRLIVRTKILRCGGI